MKSMKSINGIKGKNEVSLDSPKSLKRSCRHEFKFYEILISLEIVTGKDFCLYVV